MVRAWIISWQLAQQETSTRANRDLEVQRLQLFQAFRHYREHFEEQRRVLENRYRRLLMQSVQDALALSSKVNELHATQASASAAGAE